MNIKYQVIFQLKRIYWFVFRPKREGVKCVLVKGDATLMLKRRFGTTKWVFPGGAISRGENPEAAVRREIMEDLGIEVVKPIYLGKFLQTIHYRQETLHCYSAVIKSIPKDFDSNKIQELRMFTQRDLPPLTPVSKSVYELYKKPTG